MILVTPVRAGRAHLRKKQLGDIHRDPPRLIGGKQLRSLTVALGSSSNTPKFGPVCA
jgi:hypothetical protein